MRYNKNNNGYLKFGPYDVRSAIHLESRADNLESWCIEFPLEMGYAEKLRIKVMRRCANIIRERCSDRDYYLHLLDDQILGIEKQIDLNAKQLVKMRR